MPDAAPVIKATFPSKRFISDLLHDRLRARDGAGGAQASALARRAAAVVASGSAMVNYDPFSDAIFEDPYPTYRRLRDEAPLHYIGEYDAWFVSRFQDVWDLEQDQRNLSSKHGTTSTHLVT
jgi:cytochrome P450